MICDSQLSLIVTLAEGPYLTDNDQNSFYDSQPTYGVIDTPHTFSSPFTTYGRQKSCMVYLFDYVLSLRH